MRVLLTAHSLLTGDTVLTRPVIEIEDGVIASIASEIARPLPAASRHYDFPEGLLAPGYFDVHTHGCCGRDVMEGSQDAFLAINRFLAGHGVSAYVPTTITASRESTLRALAGMAAQLRRAPEAGCAKPAGIHLEGPFLSHAKRGAHPPQDLLEPSIPFFDQMMEAADGRVLLMTIAPELPGAPELIAHAVAKSVRISLGHSDAKAGEALASLRAGAHSATHTFNAMRALGHREPGILGTALTEDALYAEIICDGLHVDPAMVRLLARAKGRDKVMLVTDAMSATGMPDGNYKLGQLDVRVAGGRCITGEDTLAGSTLTMEEAVRNYSKFSAVPLVDAVRAASVNPRAMLGSPAGLAVGSGADLNVLRPDGELVASFVGGVRVQG